ncbi:MAG: hypothetical protein N2560_06730 [Ignavibacteria bacterium]|nr:hypothetical protein [Ignavibacteria bacterium]
MPSSPDLVIDFNEIDLKTIDLYFSEKVIMDGVYYVSEAKQILGATVAGRWVGNRCCFYSVQDVIYAECAGGIVLDNIKLTGYIRIVRSGSESKVNFTISANECAKDIIKSLVQKKTPWPNQKRNIHCFGKSRGLEQTTNPYHCPPWWRPEHRTTWFLRKQFGTYPTFPNAWCNRRRTQCS